MHSVRHKLVVEAPPIGLPNEEVEQHEKEELRAFSGISLAIGLGFAIWTVVYLTVRLI